MAIAAPDTGGGPVLDYERELRNVLAAVRAARQGAADVRVVPFATLGAIRAELDRGPAHVLHLTGHGSPGILALEDEDGSARPVTADELADLAVPPGQMPPVVVLSACYTDAAGSQGGDSFAARLCQRGAAAVIATETSITDIYATRLLARVYGALAQAGDPTSSRRWRRRAARYRPGCRPHRGGAKPARRAGGVGGGHRPGRVGVGAGPGPGAGRPRGGGAVAAAGGGAGRAGGLVFRGAAARAAPLACRPADRQAAGIVICGIGGGGKTTLAAEITARVLDREPARILVSVTGPLTMESPTRPSGPLPPGTPGPRPADTAVVPRALDAAARADLGWRDRLAILRDHVLDRVPVLVLLDNFEDNLRPGGQAG